MNYNEWKNAHGFRLPASALDTLDRIMVAQPAQEPRPPNCGTNHCSCIECYDPAYRAMVRGIGGKA